MYENGRQALPPGVADPAAMAGAAREVVNLAITVAAAAADRCRRNVTRNRNGYSRWLCWTGCVCAWPASELILGDRGYLADQTTVALLIAAPFIAVLMALRGAERRQRNEMRAAFLSRDRAAVISGSDPGLPAQNTMRIGKCEDQISVLAGEVRMMRQGLAAAYTAAGMTTRPHLALVRDQAAEPVRALTTGGRAQCSAR